MKKLFFLCCLCAIVYTSNAKPDPIPQPEKIYSITRVEKPLEYYIEQAPLWKKVIAQDRQNASAWQNYYTACRMANILTKDNVKPYNLNDIIDELAKAIPNTFEHHYLTYYNGRNDISKIDHLKKAYEINPDRYETYGEFIVYHTLRGEEEQAKDFVRKWFKSGEYSPGILAWNYNVLMSLEENAILITHGDNDTYPVWMLQYAKNVRPDVTVLSSHLLLHDDYRSKVLKRKNIDPISATLKPQKDREDMALIANHLIENARNPVYLGISAPHYIRDKHNDSLYIVGLAFKYSSEHFDNVAVLRNNYENKFMTDYLKVDIHKDISQSVLNTMNMNYIPPLMTLFNHYTTSEEFIKADEIENISLKIAKDANRESEIRTYIDKVKNRTQIVESLIPIKEIDKKQLKIKENLYASSTEVSQQEYELFLMDLVKYKEFEKISTCAVQKTDWRGLLPSSFKDLSKQDVFPNGHPDDKEMPVQNISHEAATIYCEWLTHVYNNSTNKKKRYKKVLFKLPSVDEWEYAARGGKKVNKFPWDDIHDAKPVNAKGCYLSNFFVSNLAPCEDCPSKLASNDGGFFPVPVDAYFPNDYNLYCMVGNVAEMVQEKGVAKGGSWEDTPDNSTIVSSKKYSAPSPAIGFRVFMEVIEY